MTIKPKYREMTNALRAKSPFLMLMMIIQIKKL